MHRSRSTSRALLLALVRGERLVDVATDECIRSKRSSALVDAPDRKRGAQMRCMERDSGSVTAAFHGCRSAMGADCAPADAWPRPWRAWPPRRSAGSLCRGCRRRRLIAAEGRRVGDRVYGASGFLQPSQPAEVRRRRGIIGIPLELLEPAELAEPRKARLDVAHVEDGRDLLNCIAIS